MVTRILFDPRRDLPGGTTQSNPVTIEATPTGIREDGQVVIYPTTISTPITTGADIFQLPANTASNGWRLTVRDTVTSVVKQQRVVRVPDQASIAYQSLPDIDPASFTVTPGTARQWDATFWALIQAGAGGGLTDTGIAALIGNPASAVAVSLAATYLPFWKPNTAYVAGQRVVSPTGQTITANTDFTSGATYVAGNWTVVAGGGGGTVSDATTSAKGIVQLAGDLGGTAAAPTVPGLAAKAPLVSPTFSGVPAVPTATAGTTTTQAASTAFVKAAIDALVAGAPGALDTLGEIAAQLAADESGVATLTTLIAQRTMSAAPVTLTAAGTLTPNVQNLLDATAGPFAATLPTPARIGQLLVVERADTGTNLISLAGTVRGVTTGLPTLPGLGVRGESITFAAESTSSWRILASHKPKALLDKQFDALGAANTVAASKDASQVATPVSPLVSRGAVITTGTSGAFDFGYLESPNVFFDPASGQLKMLYTGYSLATNDPNTVASIGMASSNDGYTWTKNGSIFGGSGVNGDPDSAGTTAPTIVVDSFGVYHLFYLGLTAIGYEGGEKAICHATATSLSGPWTRKGAVINKATGGTGWRWYAVWHPNIVRFRGLWYLFFNASGTDATNGQPGTIEKIGYATATSLDGAWTINDANSPIIDVFNPTDKVIGDPYVWREGDHWRMDMYRADTSYTSIGAYYATTTDDLFPLGWKHRGQVTSAGANQGVKPAAIRFNGTTFYYASYGVNIFLNTPADLTARPQVVGGLWQFVPDRSASGRPSMLVGDDTGPGLAVGTKQLAIGGSAASSYLSIGQSTSRNLLIYWQYAASAASAIAKMETFGGSNQINIQQNTGGLMLGGSGGKLGFFGITPVLKPALTYSRAVENAAQTQIRTTLVALGLITDSTTA